jgi:hypothetical protein
MYSIKRAHIIWTAIVCLIGFVIPLILKSSSETWNSTLSLSLTIVGTLLTIATLIIAVLLYDRFGINSKFKEHQVDKVIELALLLKDTNISVSTNQFTYFIHRSKSSILRRNEFPPYKIDSNKTILFPNNYDELFKAVNVIRNNYWLPIELKNRMNFLEIYGLASVEDPLDEQYVRLDINNSAEEVWMVSFPKITFEMLNVNLHDLLKEIEDWLKKHSNVLVDLRLD